MAVAVWETRRPIDSWLEQRAASTGGLRYGATQREGNAPEIAPWLWTIRANVARHGRRQNSVTRESNSLAVLCQQKKFINAGGLDLEQGEGHVRA